MKFSTCFYISLGLLTAATISLSAERKGIEGNHPETGQQAPSLYGCVIMTDSQEFNEWGIYSIPGSDESTFVRIANGGEGLGRGGGVATPDTYTAIRYYTFYGSSYVQAYTYDIETWNQVGSMKTISYDMMAYDMGYDPVSEKIYGCFYSDTDESEAWFGTVDYQNVSKNLIARIDKWNAFAFDMLGNAYVINMQGELLSVNKDTGATTLIGSTGVIPRYPSSGTIDPVSGLMYWNVCPADGHSYLYTVDLSTATATKIMQFSHDEQVMGMFIPISAAVDNAPAAAENLTLDFPEGNLSGNVSFRIPENTYGGFDLTGDIHWRVESPGINTSEGEAATGSLVSVPVNAPSAGEYTFTVTLSNAAGFSPKSRKTIFIGNGIPASTNVHAEYNDGFAVITWDSVTESIDGGYLNPDEVTYDVRRLPDDVVLARDLKANCFQSPLDKPAQITNYKYEVTPVFAGLRGEPAISNTLTLGDIIPPYYQPFDTEEEFRTFSIIDANNDSKSWEYFNGMARLYYSSVECDDWLITPAVVLDAFVQYTISFDVRNSYGADYPERIEVKAGTSPTAEGLDIPLLQPTVITNENWRSVTLEFSPSVSGLYYLGIHGISDPNMFWVGIDNLKIQGGTSQNAPASVTELKAEADFNGGKSVKISFCSPDSRLNGEPLSSIERIDIFRDEEPDAIASITDALPGQYCSYTDMDIEEGKHSYTVRVCNEDGPGVPSTVYTYVGINIPAPVTNLTMREISEGTAYLEWVTPEVDCDNHPINPSFISFTVSDIEGDEINIKDNSLTVECVSPGNQEFVRFGVTAFTETGKSDIVYTEMLPMGAPYPMPYRDSFNNDFGGIIGTSRITGNPQWGIGYDDYIAGVTAQDEDDSYIMMEASAPEDCGAIYTGKIALDYDSSPSVSLYIYQFTDGDLRDDDNTLVIEIREAGTEEYQEVGTIVNNTLPNPGWNRVVLSLNEYEGKVIQLRLKATANTYSFYVIDNLIVGTIPDKNVALISVDSPDIVLPDEEFDVKVVVDNSSLSDAEGYSVNLYANERLIGYKENLSLAEGRRTSLVFPVTLNVTEKEPVRFKAALIWDKDENTEDNIAFSSPLSVKISPLPEVEEVVGFTETDGNVQIEWEPVVLENIANEPVTDSFEDYASFSLNPGGEWSFVDVDKSRTAVPLGLEIEGLGEDGAYAFIVMDDNHPDLNGTFKAYNGSKYLMAAYATSQNDDWAISPRLSGEAQTISFFAKNYYAVYGKETFEVRCSFDGKNPEDFERLLLTRTLEGNEWEEIMVDIPDGARYAAIRYISNDQYMLFIDDFTYTPQPWFERVDLKGYNVYRDGLRINESIVTDERYADVNPGEGLHYYQVSAVYDKGESAASYPVFVEISGVDRMGTDIRVSVSNQSIIVKGGAGHVLRIFNIAGSQISAENIHSDIMEIPVERGMYIVNIDGRSYKLLVP